MDVSFFKNRSFWVQGISCLFILLFVYAATSKLLDFQQFKVQLGQSPLLTSIAPIIVFLVPISELIIAGLLSFAKYRVIGLYASLILMGIFTTYIAIILKYSPFVPCSCGGILDSMGWRDHILLNITFMVLALLGIVLIRKPLKRLSD